MNFPPLLLPPSRSSLFIALPSSRLFFFLLSPFAARPVCSSSRKRARTPDYRGKLFALSIRGAKLKLKRNETARARHHKQVTSLDKRFSRRPPLINDSEIREKRWLIRNILNSLNFPSVRNSRATKLERVAK